MVTCLQTCPSAATSSRFHQQVLRDSSPVNQSRILLGWATSQLQNLVWFQSLTESCVKTQNYHWEEDRGALPKQLHPPVLVSFSNGCRYGPGAGANVLLYRLRVISFSPGSTSEELGTDEQTTEGILLVNHARLLTMVFNYPCKKSLHDMET